MKQIKKVELLAPAGNKEAFLGAIHAGADAVYLAGNRFGARAYADNFTEDELIDCIRYAHLFGRRIYLTVNTLIKEAEFSELYDYLLPYYKAGLDGVIVQDIGVFAFVRKHFPDMELHVSTQMTITGKYSASLLKEMGACRVVPARELSLEEMVSIKEATGLEIEAFIHGAMCYCYSGQCLFSSILGGRSGNRGRCAQPCRLPYKVQDKDKITKECYPLSLKDMCTIEYLPQLIEAGIDSFKIEGRMKKPEYAAGVTAIYRKYIDKYYNEKGKPFHVSKKDLDKLSCLYIRSERQDGYYHKHNGKDMITLDSPAYSGSDDNLLAHIRTTYLEQAPKQSIIMYGTFLTGEKASVTLVMDDLSVTVAGEIVSVAQKQPITSENVEKQLKKLGDSIFQASDIMITISENAFYPLKAINELRRKAVIQLENALIHKYGLPLSRNIIDETTPEPNQGHKQPCKITEDTTGNASNQQIYHAPIVSVRTLAQLHALQQYSKTHAVSKLYVDADLLRNLKTNGSLETELKPIALTKCEIIVALPFMLRKSDEAYLRELLTITNENKHLFSGFLVRNLEGMGFLHTEGYNGAIYADAGFYVWNRETLKEWQGMIKGFCIPYELKSGEQKSVFNGEVLCEKIIYGRIPMMLTANCVAKTTDNCRKGKGESQLYLIDRYQKKFPVVLNCIHCMNIIYNTVPLSLHGEWGKWKERAAMRLDFTIESENETYELLSFFGSLYNGRTDIKLPIDNYTTGHEKRGVE